jgi:lambda repressor-like predicted transcriptional regulator
MMNYLENLRQIASSVRWEESAPRLQEIKVQLVKRGTSALLALTLNSGLALQALTVVLDQD